MDLWKLERDIQEMLQKSFEQDVSRRYMFLQMGDRVCESNICGLLGEAGIEILVNNISINSLEKIRFLSQFKK